jgi:hypothetical protein
MIPLSLLAAITSPDLCKANAAPVAPIAAPRIKPLRDTLALCVSLSTGNESDIAITPFHCLNIIERKCELRVGQLNYYALR